MLGENISSGCGFGCLWSLNSPQTTGQRASVRHQVSARRHRAGFRLHATGSAFIPVKAEAGFHTLPLYILKFLSQNDCAAARTPSVPAMSSGWRASRLKGGGSLIPL